MKEKVSFYIPCYNSSKTIERCLESAIGQTYEAAEIIVIDDGSSDDTAKKAEGYGARVIRNSVNKGLSCSRNIAFRESRHEFVATIDSDCQADSYWLERLMGHAVKEGVAGAGGRLTETNQDRVADRWRAAHMVQAWGEHILDCPPFLYGSNTVFKKDIVKKIGFYDAGLVNNYEDVELSRRIYREGFKLIYEPQAQVSHLRNDTVTSVLRNYWGWQEPVSILPGRSQNKLRRVAAGLSRFYEQALLLKRLFEEDSLSGRSELLPLDSLCMILFMWKNSKAVMREILR